MHKILADPLDMDDGFCTRANPGDLKYSCACEPLLSAVEHNDN